MSTWKYSHRPISPERDIEEELKKASRDAKLYDKINHNTTFYSSHTGEEMNKISIIQIISVIKDTSSILSEWESIHGERHRVHFSFEGKAYRDPAVITKYKMSKRRRDLFGGKSVDKIRRGKVKMVQMNTTFFHVDAETGVTSLDDQERCREASERIVVNYCTFEGWWENRKGKHHVYCLTSSQPVTFKFTQSEDELWGGTREGCSDKWKRDNSHLIRYCKSSSNPYPSLRSDTVIVRNDMNIMSASASMTRGKWGHDRILIKSESIWGGITDSPLDRKN